MNFLLDFILLHVDHHHAAAGAPLIIGLVASILHVVSGPDHLAAVTPLAIDNKLKAWIVGLGWGLGHTSGMLLIGLLFLLFKNMIPVEAISGYSEILVGFILVGIGLWAFWRIFRQGDDHRHQHPHSHHTESGEVITHIHEHDHPAVNAHEHQHIIPVKQSFISAMLIGTLHGLAGVSHLLSMLPTLAFTKMQDSAMYLTGFGFGTIFAMVAFSFLLGFVSWKSDDSKKPFVFKTIRFIGATASLLVGIFWITTSI